MGINRSCDEHVGDKDMFQRAQETVTHYTQNELKGYWLHFQEKYPSGSLSKKEFVRENIKLRGGTEDVWEMVFTIIDADGSKSIDFQEYMIFLATIDETKSSEEMLNTTFDLVDLDGNGVLDAEELEWIVKVIAKERKAKSAELYGKKFESLSVEDYVKELFLRMDENNDGVIDRNEFLTTCLEDAEIREVLCTPLQMVQVILREHEILDTPDEESGLAKEKEMKEKYVFKGDRIYKKLDPREFNFYETVQDSEEDEELAQFLPGYYGRGFINQKKSPNDSDFEHYLVLENLTYGMTKPCILEARMGDRKHGSGANKSKGRQLDLENVVHSQVLGFRLCGLQVYKKPHDAYYKMNKFKCARETTNKIEDIFVMFVNNGSEIRRGVAQRAVSFLRKIEKYMETQTKYVFTTTSLLFIYDGAEGAKDDIRVVLVDFEKVDTSNKIDKTFLYGLKCLIKIWDAVANAERLKKGRKDDQKEKNWYEKIRNEFGEV